MRFNKLIPELRASNFAKSLEFYTKILKFKVEYERKESKFAFLSLEGTQIMIEQNTAEWNTGELNYPYGRGINLQRTLNEMCKIKNYSKFSKRILTNLIYFKILYRLQLRVSKLYWIY